MNKLLGNWTLVTGLSALAAAILVFFGLPIVLPAVATRPRGRRGAVGVSVTPNTGDSTARSAATMGRTSGDAAT